METIYNVDYFIKKFEAIPENKFSVGTLTSINEDGFVKHCSIGHCGVTRSIHEQKPQEAVELVKLFGCTWDTPKEWRVMSINDGNSYCPHEYVNLTTPKQRILAALYDIKAKQQPTVKEVIKYVTVDASVRELQEKVLSEN